MPELALSSKLLDELWSLMDARCWNYHGGEFPDCDQCEGMKHTMAVLRPLVCPAGGTNAPVPSNRVDCPECGREISTITDTADRTTFGHHIRR